MARPIDGATDLDEDLSIKESGDVAEHQVRWPDYFPPGCPPADSVVADGTVFRLVEAIPAQEVDALPHIVRYPERRLADSCLACGLSVYRQLHDLQRLQRRVPALAGKAAAQIDLNPSMGVLKPTPAKAAPDSHHTWWVPDGLEVWRNFLPIDDGGN